MSSILGFHSVKKMLNLNSLNKRATPELCWSFKYSKK